MKEYMISVIGIVLISAIIITLQPEGKTGAVIKGVSKLSCLLVILAPIGNFFQDKHGEKSFFDFSLENVIETDEAFIDYCSRTRVENAEVILQDRLYEKFDCAVQVDLQWEYAPSITGEASYKDYVGKEVKITGIFLSGVSDEKTQEEIRTYLKNTYPFEVIFYA